jgi:hypothetical protein
MLSFPMNTATTFENINIDQLTDVVGGFDWGSFGRATLEGANTGMIYGSRIGGVAGGIAAALPGAMAGAVGGGAVGGTAGAITAGVYNVGQQFGWWK